MEEYKTIRRFDNSPEANMAKNYLTQNGILAILNDEHVGQIFNPAVKGIKLDVPVEQYDKAKELIDEVDKETVERNLIVDILEECDCLLDGHFKLTSGLHSDKYIEKIKVIQEPEKVVTIADMFALKMHDIEADIVIGMAMGGIVLGYETAKQMNKQFAFTQRKDGKMIIRKGFDIEPGMKAIVIEDVVTTGGSVKEVLELLKSLDVEVQAVGLIVDRTGGEVDFGVRTEVLLNMKVDAHQPGDCPLCKEGVALTTPGSSDK